jgi:Leucine-rich repeat (LRR) protein
MLLYEEMHTMRLSHYLSYFLPHPLPHRLFRQHCAAVLLVVVTVLGGVLCCTEDALAITYYWRTAVPGGTQSWNNPANWSTVGHGSAMNTGTFPGMGDEAVFGDMFQTPNNITFTNLPTPNGVGRIVATTLQRTLTIPAGENLILTAVGMASYVGGNGTIEVLDGGQITISNSASIDGAGGGVRWRINGAITPGVLEIQGTGAVNTACMGFFGPFATLRYTLGIDKIIGSEFLDGMTGLPYVGGFPGRVECNKFGGTLRLGSARTFGNNLNITFGTFNGGPAQDFTVNGTTNFSGGTCWFAGQTIMLNGPITFGTTAFTTNGAETVMIGNTPGGAITGNFSVGSLGILNMNRAGQVLTMALAPSFFGVSNVNAGTVRLDANGTVMGTLNVNGGGTFQIAPNRTLTNSGALNVHAAGTLELQGAAAMMVGDVAMNPVVYTAPTATLRTTGNIGAYTPNVRVMPNPVMPGSLDVQHAFGSSLAIATAQSITGTFNFVSGQINAPAPLTLGGAVIFGAGQFSAPFSSLVINGAGAVTGTFGASTPTLSMNSLVMNRAAQTLTIGANSLTLAAPLSINAGTVALTGGQALTLNAASVVNGTLSVPAAGTLVINGASTVSGSGAVNYVAATSALRYTGTSGTAGNELPAIMNGRTIVDRTNSFNSVLLYGSRTFNSTVTVNTGYLEPSPTPPVTNITLANAMNTIGANGRLRASTLTSPICTPNAINLTGNLTVDAGGVVEILSQGNWTGNSPNYLPGGALTYAVTGSPCPVAKTTGTEFPNAMNGNVFVLNGASVTLGANKALNGTLTITNPTTLNTGAFVLTYTNTITPAQVNPNGVLNVSPNGRLVLPNTATVTNNGSLNVAPAGTLEIQGTGNVATNPVAYDPTGLRGTLLYTGNLTSITPPETFPNIMPGNVVVNKTGGNVALFGASKTVQGLFSMQNGVFNLGGGGLGLALTGSYARTAGVFRATGPMQPSLTVNCDASVGLFFEATPNNQLNTLTGGATTVRMGSNVVANNVQVPAGTLDVFTTTMNIIGPAASSIGATLNVPNMGRLVVQNGVMLTNSGSLTVGGGGTLEIQNNPTLMGTPANYTAPNSVLMYTGTMPKTATAELGAGFGGSIVVNNTGNVTAPNFTLALPATGSFTLQNGRWLLSTAAAQLQLGSAALVGGSAASYVQTAGENNLVSRSLPAGVGIYPFPIGTAAGYRPLVVIDPTGAATVSASVVNGAPSGGIDGAGIVGAATAGEYWCVSAGAPCTGRVELGKAGAVTAQSRMGLNGSGAAMGAGVYNQVISTPNPTNDITTDVTVNFAAGPNFQRLILGGNQAITGLSQLFAPAGVGISLTLTGENFPLAPTVTFSGTPVMVTASSPTSITIMIPAGLMTVGSKLIQINALPQLQATFNVVPSVPGTVVITLDPEADTQLASDFAATNYGLATLMRVQPPLAPSQRRDILLRFNLSTIPPGSVINNSVFRITSNTGFAWGGDGNQNLSFVANDAWLENAITWNDEATVPGSTALGSWWTWYGFPQYGMFQDRTFEVGVTPQTAAEYAGNQLFSMRVSSPGYGVEYYTKEHGIVAQRPKLIVTYTPPPPVLTTLVPASMPLGAVGFPLTLNGNFLTPVATLTFNGTDVVPQIASAASGQIIVNLPASLLVAPVGLKNVTITTAGGAAALNFNLLEGVYYLRAGQTDIATLANWNSDPSVVPTGVQPNSITPMPAPSRFVIAGNGAVGTTIATMSANMTIPANVTLDVMANSALRIATPQSLTNNGTLQIRSAATLELNNDGAVVGANLTQYDVTPTRGNLRYTGNSTRQATTQEFPGTLAANLLFDRTGGTFTFGGGKVVQGSMTMTGGTADVLGIETFRVDGTALLSGGVLNHNSSGNLTFAGATSISGATVNLFNAGNAIFSAATTVTSGVVTSAGGTGGIQANDVFDLQGGTLALGSSAFGFVSNGSFLMSNGIVDVGVSTMNLNGSVNFGAAAATGVVHSVLNSGVISINPSANGVTGFLKPNTSTVLGGLRMNRASAALTLGGTGLATQALSLNAGFINTSAASTLSVLSPVGVVGGSPTAFVNGPLDRVVPSGVATTTFPVGKAGTYLPLSFVNVTGATVVARVEAFAANSNGSLGVGITDLSTTEYWQTTLLSGTFTEGLFSLERPLALIPQNVVARSAGSMGMANGEYTTAGALSITGNAITSRQVNVFPNFLAIAGPPAVNFYYISGAPENPANWRSTPSGGAPAANFATPGNRFIVLNGRVADLDAPLTLSAGVTLQVDAGGTFTIRPTRTLTNNSAVDVRGLLRIEGDGAVAGNLVVYAPTGAALEYAGAAVKLTSDVEFPTSMLGSVVVSNAASVRLNADKTVFGSFTQTAGVVDLNGNSITLSGAATFVGGQWTGSASSNLSVAGTGAIVGTLRGTGAGQGALLLRNLFMSRLNTTLSLGSPTTVSNTLTLLNGIINVSTANLTLATPSALAISGGNANAYVIGPLHLTLPPMLNAGNIELFRLPIGTALRYQPAALLSPVTGASPVVVEAQAYRDSTGRPGAGVLFLPRNDYTRLRTQTAGTQNITAQVQLIRPTMSVLNVLVSTTAVTEAFNAVPSGVTGDVLQSTNRLRIDSTNRYFMAGSLGAPPVIAEFSPTMAGAGMEVTIVGINFNGTTGVLFGGVQAQSFTVVSNTEIRVIVPPNATNGTLTVTSLSGSGDASVPFTRIFPPIITSFSPASGAEGALLTVTGANFSNVLNVRVGGVAVNNFTVNSPERITARVGNGATGVVSVSTLGGSTSSTQQFVFLRVPRVLTISPTSGTIGGEVILTGRNFSGTTSVQFGDVTAATFRVLSDSVIVVEIPENASTPIQVFNPLGSTTGSQVFRYTMPPIVPILTGVTYITTATLSSTGGIVFTTPPNFDPFVSTTGVVEIRGRNLFGVTNVFLGGSTAATFTVSTDGTLMYAVFSTSASGQVIVRTSTIGTATSGFTFSFTRSTRATVLPEIVDFTPKMGGALTQVIIRGRNFANASSVSFGGIAALTYIVRSESEIFAVVSTRGASGRIEISAGDGRAQSQAEFIFTTATQTMNTPVITAITPTIGTTGTLLVIVGENFSAVRSVSIGGVAVRDFARVSAREITAVAGNGNTGRVLVRFTDGTEAQSQEIFTFGTPLAGNLASDSTVLVQFYLTAGGRAWRRQGFWLTSAPVSTWDGVTVQGGRVVRLVLPNNNIAGAMPEAFGRLDALKTLDLSQNALGMEFPRWLGRLASLQELRLAATRLSGTIADSLAELRNLHTVNLDTNQLTGRLPDNLCALTLLRELTFSRNRLVGVLPECLGGVNTLEVLVGNENQLVGELPAAFATLRRLRILSFRNNQLTGTLPRFAAPDTERTLAQASAQSSEQTSAQAKAVAGAERGAAAETQEPSQLETLDVTGNFIGGSIPPTLGNALNLRNLLLGANRLTGAIPFELWNARSLQVVELHNNRLVGTLSSSIAGATFLRRLTLNNNQLTGAVPDSIVRLQQLQTLNLAANRLTFVPDLTAMRRLDTLNLERNNLTFESIEPNLSATGTRYVNQDNIGVERDTIGILGKPFRVSITVGGSANAYQWFRREWVRGTGGQFSQVTTAIGGQSSPTLFLPSFDIRDTVSYICQITNERTPLLTLTTRPLNVRRAFAPDPPVQAPNLVFPSIGASGVPTFVTLAWTEVPDEYSYNVQVGTSPNFDNSANLVTAATVSARLVGGEFINATEATFRGLRNATQYFWRVRAVNAGGTGRWSTTGSFTTVLPDLALAWTTADAGRESVGERKRGLTALVTNVTEQPVTITGIRVQETENSFEIASASAIRLLPSQSVRVPYTFAPRSVGRKQGTVTLEFRQDGLQNASVAQTQSVPNGLVGRGGALFVKEVNFDTVLAGRTAIASAVIVNRGRQPITLRSRQIQTADDPFRVFSLAINDADDVYLGESDSTAVIVRCRSNSTGNFRASLLITGESDTVQTSLQATARLPRTDDIIVSMELRPSRDTSAPGEPLELLLVLRSNANTAAGRAAERQRLFNADQPVFQGVVRFHKQVLALDPAETRAQAIPNSDRRNRFTRVRLFDRWSGVDSVLFRLRVQAVSGDTDRTALDVESLLWGAQALGQAGTFAQGSVRRVFVDAPSRGVFTSGVCQTEAAGVPTKRLTRTTSSVSLSKSRPNPTSDEAQIAYTIREAGLVNIVLVDAKGSVVSTLISRHHAPGSYETTLKARNLPSGSYTLVLTTPTERVDERVEIVR